MAIPYHLSIITPYGKALEKDVVFLRAPGAGGEFGVLAKHAPMTAKLKAGVLNVKDGTDEINYAIGGGVLEINEKSQVLILSDIVDLASNEDDAKAKVQNILNEKKKAA